MRFTTAAQCASGKIAPPHEIEDVIRRKVRLIEGVEKYLGEVVQNESVTAEYLGRAVPDSDADHEVDMGSMVDNSGEQEGKGERKTTIWRMMRVWGMATIQRNMKNRMATHEPGKALELGEGTGDFVWEFGQFLGAHFVSDLWDCDNLLWI
jgi:hypothetical protein